MEFLENAPIGFLHCEQNGKVKQVNQTLADWLGYTKEEILGAEGWQKFLSMGSKIYFETHFYPLLHIQSSALEIHLDLLKKDKTVFSVLVNTKILDQTEKEYIVFLLDITQRRQYEKELMLLRRKAEEYANQLKIKNEELSRFTRVAAHDLRSPLATMLGFIEFIIYTYDDLSKEEILTHLETINKTGKKLLEFINNLLLYYKQEAQLVSQKPINLKETLQEIINVHNFANEYEINIEGEDICTNYTKIFWQLVLGNLISNAIKYCDKEKVIIHISWKKENSKLFISIQDNGKGIPKQEQEKIFLAFYHSDQLDRFKNRGTGIGLALIKQLVEKIGGKISLESELGKGSIFMIELPIEHFIS